MIYEGTDKLDVHKLQILGILWCNGDDKKKATQLYLLLQERNSDRINSHDKDFPRCFNTLLDTATEMVFRFESKYMKTTKRLISEAIVQQTKGTYEELSENFIDEIFGSDSMLKREDWIKQVSQFHKWIFNAN